MLDAKRLQPIRQLCEQREDAAAEALAEARRVLALRESQLRELENYREPTLAAATIESLRNREAFRLKLAEAIVQQRRAIELQKRQVEQQRRHWIDSRRESDLYDKLAQRSLDHERARLERRAQRDLDELALRVVVSGESGT